MVKIAIIVVAMLIGLFSIWIYGNNNPIECLAEKFIELELPVAHHNLRNNYDLYIPAMQMSLSAMNPE